MTFGSSDLSTRRALNELGNHLCAQGVPVARRETVQIVVAEALNNITEHAYAGRVGPVRLECRCTPDRLEISIQDHGTPAPDNLISGVGVEPPKPGDLPEGGFGWFLIRSLSNGVRQTSGAGRNELLVAFDTP